MVNSLSMNLRETITVAVGEVVIEDTEVEGTETSKQSIVEHDAKEGLITRSRQTTEISIEELNECKQDVFVENGERTEGDSAIPVMTIDKEKAREIAELT